MTLDEAFTYRYCKNNGDYTTGEDLKFKRPTYIYPKDTRIRIVKSLRYNVWEVQNKGKTVFRHWHWIQCAIAVLGRDHPYVVKWEADMEEKIKAYEEEGDNLAKFLKSRRVDAVRETCKELNVFPPTKRITNQKNHA